jgi:hypothetical protein
VKGLPCWPMRFWVKTPADLVERAASAIAIIRKGLSAASKMPANRTFQL